MTIATTSKLYNQVQSLLQAADGFQSVRQLALENLETTGFPAPKAEEYKFTNLTKKLENALTNTAFAKSFSLDQSSVDAHIFADFDGDVLVFTNGFWNQELSSISQEYQVSSVKEDALVGSIAKPGKDAFADLNTVAFQEVIKIRVAKGKVIEKPVLLLHLNQPSDGQILMPRLLVEVDEVAQVTLLEYTVDLEDGVYFSNALTEVRVGAASHVNFFRLQNQSSNAIVMDTLETDIHRDSVFTSVKISLAADMIRNNLTLNLLDSGCEGNMYGLYLLNGKVHVDNHTNVDHTKPHAVSNELYKGILTDSSRGVFNGKIFVRQDAQKTNAFQQNNNILLSENAIINTKPQLEIWADDVKCSHGCTTGQLDEEALFYLQARGLDKTQAKGMLLYAFAGEVLEFISDEPFKAYITNLVVERLGTQF
ncbi:Fe-S cluster assembly protein SufD [Mongoliitalea daihaiensis]|nr:Fe-S cluster assembly protein SufD [Mongoliitalea daihaiensis]